MVLLGVLSTVRQKSFERKSWYPPSIQKLFRQRKLSEKRKVPLRSFSVLWENQLSTESWYNILCNFFNPELFSIKRVTLGIFSGLSDKKVTRENRDIPFQSTKFFDKRKFLKNERFPYKTLRYCEKINFRRSRDTPSYAMFFNPEIFWKKGST